MRRTFSSGRSLPAPAAPCPSARAESQPGISPAEALDYRRTTDRGVLILSSYFPVAGMERDFRREWISHLLLLLLRGARCQVRQVCQVGLLPRHLELHPRREEGS